MNDAQDSINQYVVKMEKRTTPPVNCELKIA